MTLGVGGRDNGGLRSRYLGYWVNDGYVYCLLLVRSVFAIRVYLARALVMNIVKSSIMLACKFVNQQKTKCKKVIWSARESNPQASARLLIQCLNIGIDAHTTMPLRP